MENETDYNHKKSAVTVLSLTDNPYAPPRGSNTQNTRSSPSLSAVEIWSGRVACCGLFIFASLYFPALVFDPEGAVTIAGMLGISSASEMVTLKIVYTVCLFASSIGYLLDRVHVAFFAAVVIGVITTFAIIASVTQFMTVDPFYSVTYRFGEIMTALTAILMLVALARRVFTDCGRRFA